MRYIVHTMVCALLENLNESIYIPYQIQYTNRIIKFKKELGID